ncbi:MAG: Hsp20/alpha crystallin family protein [Planctomycetaceae bacterium]
MGSSAPENMPETPSERLRDFVVSCLDAVAAQGGKAVEALQKASHGGSWVPLADVVETEEQVQVVVDLPGVDPRQVEILLTGNMLTIKGQRPASAPAALRRERASGSFNRSFPLPYPVDPERVSASSSHGVLTITLGKEDRVRPRHIPVHIAAEVETSGVQVARNS